VNIIDFIRKFRFIREVGNNRGQRVEAIQHWSGGDAAEGLSWCADWATMMWDVWFEGKSPIDRTASCDVILEQARKKNMLTTTPNVGDLALRLNNPNDAHHVLIVTDVSKWSSEKILTMISGNTSEDGKSSNGDRVAERDDTIKDTSKIIFVHAPNGYAL
jgi:hypothetical protein